MGTIHYSGTRRSCDPRLQQVQHLNQYHEGGQIIETNIDEISNTPHRTIQIPKQSKDSLEGIRLKK